MPRHFGICGNLKSICHSYHPRFIQKCWALKTTGVLKLIILTLPVIKSSMALVEYLLKPNVDLVIGCANKASADAKFNPKRY